jgi:putative membrane protein
MKLAALCLLGAGALGCASAHAATPQDTIFVHQAALGGMTEVQAGQLAETKATAPAVKDFAAKMVADHTPNNQELLQLADSKGITPPDALDQRHRRQLAALRAAPASRFDSVYIRTQIAGHEAMEAVMRKEIRSGTDPDLKAFATKTLPVVLSHLQLAEQLAATTK